MDTNILSSFLHKVCVGDFLRLENEFFPHPPFEKYSYQILSKSDAVTVSAKNYGGLLNKVIRFRFNTPGTVFINIKNNDIRQQPMNIVVEVSSLEEEF